MIKKFNGFLVSSKMWDTKRQIQFVGIRYNTINVKKKNTKFDVNVSEMQKPVDF